MLRYFVRRLCYSILVLWGVATLVFLLFQVLPVNRARVASGQPPSFAGVEATRLAPRLDQSLLTRYGLYLNDLSPIGVTTNKGKANAPTGLRLTRLADSSYLSLKAPFLGRSSITAGAVSARLDKSLPGTMALALIAMLMATMSGLGFGMLAALKKHTIWDTGTITATIAGMSMPSFFAALMIACIFGCQTGGQQAAARHLMLPVFVLSIRPMAMMAQVMRLAMLDVLGQDYIRTAYAKGLSKVRVVFRHALPNALGAVLKSAPAWIAELLAGAFFVEYIFRWKGIGQATVNALDKSDLPLVTGAILQMALIFIVVKLLAEMLYGLLDPRVRS